MKLESRRIIALLLMFVTITGLLATFGENVLCAGELSRDHETASVLKTGDATQINNNCPCAPSPLHSPNDHFCVGDFGSPGYAPLPSMATTLTNPQSLTCSYHDGPARYITEVYLSLFVPPDSPNV